MSSFITNGRFPPINRFTTGDVSIEERCTAIDFVNCHNFVFQEFNIDKMLDTFLEKALVYHSHGTVHGHAEMKPFLEDFSEFFIHGISRNASNHVVDRDGDGGVFGPSADAIAGHDTIRHDTLPEIWWVEFMIDRLRMTSNGWKVHERYLGTPYRDQALDPKEHSKSDGPDQSCGARSDAT
ncbi:hypothetical protein N7468_006159 [Penicillium chermesinum]|uniref:SnoaL-like domain-containing protein n=1 Tax=Penicillium chermesinum TaxID=63820 RepID=A0A9W9NUJ3_9EURO|nr:uncharacterized protein N7468_006159 [Penicillium chermesinum]KAJ5224934.1 hypothetical protein N7468_006159 [Penicillium chermesinum]KAJ6151667.1 hypothetical protein N7470_006795 [Penicillium chermesinum]